MIRTISDAQSALTPVFDRYGISRAVLFGSVAKGTATQKSDLDILVDSKLRGLKFVGFMEAVRQAVEWMFANTPIIRIFAAAYATNSASQRVLVKAGFRHVGTFRKAFFKNGAFVDGCYYELLKDENE